MTRFADGAALTVSGATQEVPPPLDAQGMPTFAFAAGADHVVTLDATGEARCWTLPP